MILDRYQSALARFREGADTRADRDVLREYRIMWVTIAGKPRRVPTVEEEDAPPDPPESVSRRAPKVLKF